MPKKRSWTNEQLVAAVKNNYSMRATLIEINLNATGGNYKSIKSHIANLELSTSHWTGKGHLKGKSHGWSKPTPDSDVFKKDSKYMGTGNAIKQRLVRDHSFKYSCSNCELDKWLDKPISLHLDHINGVKNDNRLENLRLLCPNCHSQTETYAGKNKKNHRKLPHGS